MTKYAEEVFKDLDFEIRNARFNNMSMRCSAGRWKSECDRLCFKAEKLAELLKIAEWKDICADIPEDMRDAREGRDAYRAMAEEIDAETEKIMQTAKVMLLQA